MIGEQQDDSHSLDVDSPVEGGGLQFNTVLTRNNIHKIAKTFETVTAGIEEGLISLIKLLEVMTLKSDLTRHELFNMVIYNNNYKIRLDQMKRSIKNHTDNYLLKLIQTVEPEPQ